MAAMQTPGAAALPTEPVAVAPGSPPAAPAEMAPQSPAELPTVSPEQAAYEQAQYLGDDPGRDAENALIFGGLSLGLGAAGKVIGRGASKGSRFADDADSASLDDVAKAAESQSAAKSSLVVAPGSVGAAAARESQRAAVEDGLDRALSNASKADAEDLIGKALKTETAPVSESDRPGRQRRLYENRGAILDVATREMQRDLTAVVAELPELARGGKLADVSRNVGENAAAQRTLADGIAKSAAEFAGAMRGEARAVAAEFGKKGLQYVMPGQKALTLALMDNAKAITEAEGGKATYEALSAFERTLRETDPELSPKLASFSAKVRTALEDGQVWGKAGDMQKAQNAVVRDQLLPSMQAFEQSVLGRISKGDAVWTMDGWESKVKGLLEEGDPAKLQQIGSVLDGLAQLAKVRAEYGDAAGGKTMAEQVSKIRRTLELASEVGDATVRTKALGESEAGYITGDMAGAFRRLGSAVDTEIDKGVDDWIASSVARGKKGSMLGELGGFAARAVTDDSPTAQLARKKGISRGMAEFMGDDASPTAAFERARAALHSDETFFASMADDYKSLQERAPETYMMLAGNAAKLRQFLIQRMPPNVSVSMMNPEGYPPAREAIEDWAVYLNAARNPRQVVRNVRGASVQEIQTLQEGFPRLYERTQQKVIEKIGQARTNGQQLDDTLLMRMQTLFPDVDGVGSPAFSRATAKLVNEYTQSQAAAPGAGPNGKPPQPPAPSPLQTIAQNGATFGSGF